MIDGANIAKEEGMSMKKIAIVLCIALVTVLSGCGYTESDLENAYEAGYDQGYEDGYSATDFDFREALNEYREQVPSLSPISMPASGTILSGMEYNESEITVHADGGSSYVVSLKNIKGSTRVSFFVRAGDTVTVGVPDEYLYVYFASGTSWYGYGEGLMFGENTAYSKDDDLVDFTEYTWEYTLYPVSDGNFTETPSNENEFF